MSTSQSLNQARAVALEVAARLLVKELDAAAVASLRAPALREALSAYDDGCAAYLDALDAGGAATLDAATEFCGLFVLGKGTSPYASAWMGSDPAEMGAAVSRSVAVWMDQLGVDVAPGAWGNIPRDHVAVLCGLVALALLAPEPAGERLAREIVGETLGWVPAFADAVTKTTSNPLYRAAARLVQHALADLGDDR